MIKQYVFDDGYIINECRRTIEYMNRLGANLVFSELYEEDDGILCQVHGKEIDIKLAFHLYDDIDGKPFMWCMEKYMDVVPKGRKACKVCGDMMGMMYVVIVDNERMEQVCRGCLNRIARFYKFICDKELNYESYGWYSSVPKSRRYSKNFIGYVLFYAENVYLSAVHHVDSLRKIFYYDDRVLPVSEYTRDYLDWLKRTDEHHYPSWITRRFLEKGGLPVLPGAMCEKFLEAALDYVEEKGIEIKSYPIEDGLPKNFRDGKRCTDTVIPIDLHVSSFDRDISFIGLVDGKPGVFYTRSNRKTFDVSGIVWGVPMRLRFGMYRNDVRWGNHTVRFGAKNLLSAEKG